MAAVECDNLLQMDVADADGTEVTASILANGVVGPNLSAGNWSLSSSPLGIAVSDDLAIALLGPITVRSVGVVDPATDTFRNIAIDHEVAQFRLVNAGVSGLDLRTITVMGLLHIGVPDQAPSGTLYDFLRVDGEITGRFAVMQLLSGASPHGFALNVETNPGGVTTHSDYIGVSPDTTYWFCLRASFDTGIAELAVYLPSGSLVGLIDDAVMETGEDIGSVRFGQGETGTAEGATSYFQAIALDYTEANFPVGPPLPEGAGTSHIIGDSGLVF